MEGWDGGPPNYQPSDAPEPAPVGGEGRRVTCICGVSFREGSFDMLKVHANCPKNRFNDHCPRCGSKEHYHVCEPESVAFAPQVPHCPKCNCELAYLPATVYCPICNAKKAPEPASPRLEGGQERTYVGRAIEDLAHRVFDEAISLSQAPELDEEQSIAVHGISQEMNTLMILAESVKRKEETLASQPQELEISDKAGWVYDPDAKLAEVRATHPQPSAPQEESICSPHIICGDCGAHMSQITVPRQGWKCLFCASQPKPKAPPAAELARRMYEHHRQKWNAERNPASVLPPVLGSWEEIGAEDLCDHDYWTRMAELALASLGAQRATVSNDFVPLADPDPKEKP